ncbi:hypothetical protein WN944_024238 [Citrus x changshan-huyou]|uniref:Uncharacterized protein n=1 Tax=Citrus x changshan-huyou TaxID=2935761 RepID=A0AAP0QB18_9ROSI
MEEKPKQPKPPSSSSNCFPSNLHPDGASDGCRFYSLDERKFYFQKNSVFKDFGKRHLYWFISRMARSLR